MAITTIMQLKDAMLNTNEKDLGILKTQPALQESDSATNSKTTARILAKLYSGKRLSAKELSYLRTTDINLYQKALMFQKKREAFEQALKSCRSKEEVTQRIQAEYSTVSEKDPDKEMKLAIIDNVVKEFKGTKNYQSLPATTDDAKKMKNKITTPLTSDSNSETSSVTYETTLGSYQMAYDSNVFPSTDLS